MNFFGSFVIKNIYIIYVYILFLNIPLYVGYFNSTFSILIQLTILFTILPLIFITKIKDIPLLSLSLLIALVFISSFYYVLYNDSYAADYINDQVLTIIRFLSLILLFLYLNTKVKKMYKHFVFIGLIITFLNAIDFFDSGLIFPEITPGLATRASGFYVNPNRSVEALLITMCLSVPFMQKKYRLLFCISCLVGIFFTLGRGGILLWIGLMTYFSVAKYIDLRSVIIGSVLLVIFGSAVYSFIDYSLSTIDEKLISGRLGFFQGDIQSGILEDDRSYAASRAWSLFLKNPLSGMGPYAMYRDGADLLSHNQYLFFLSDFGIIGIIWYIYFLFTIFDLKKSNNIPAFIYIILWSIFTHLIITSVSNLILMAYFACWNKKANKQEV